jgi:hypothetical protein
LIPKIRRVVSLGTGTTKAWADLALDAGFYDQTRMIADFRDLLRTTPEAFLLGGLAGEQRPREGDFLR